MQGQITTSLATVLLLGSLAASSLAGGAGPMTSAAAQEPDPFVGEQMCARCHGEINEALTGVSHGSGAGEMLAEAGCQSCHGPGRRHVQRPNDTDLTPSVERMTRSEQGELCTSCHSDTPAFDPTHEVAQVSCSGCHIFHQKRADLGVMRWQPRCLSCHAGSEAFDVLHEYDLAALSSGTVSCRSCHQGAHEVSPRQAASGGRE